MTNKEDGFLFQKGNPLIPGVTRASGGYHFCASFLEPEKAVLHICDPDKEEIQSIPMKEGRITGASAAVCVDIPEGRDVRYFYTLNGRNVTDPYAKAVLDGLYGLPTLPPYAEEGRRVRISPEDMILYKLHVRGYTKQDPSVPEEERGTFAGLIRKIPYLSGLGINTVELMPVYTFDAVLPSGRKNYWGYAENNYYFAPNSAYSHSVDPAGEIASLIDALHKAGIACILEFFIPESVSIRLLADALHYWAFALGADGFHLTGKYAAVGEVLLDPCLADRILLLDSSVQAVSQQQQFRSFDHVYAMQHDFRRTIRKFLKGSEADTAAYTEGFRCCPAQYHVVNYAADHNGFTLQDLVSYNEKRNEANGEGNRDGSPDNDSWNCGEEGPTAKRKVLSLRKRQVRNAILLVFLAQGIPMLYAGDEFGNSQRGNNNAYCLDDPDGWLCWEDAKTNADLIRFVKSVIRFRKDHPILHTGSALWGSDYDHTGTPDISFHSRERFSLENGYPAAGILFNGHYAKTPDSMIFLAMNTGDGSYAFVLPELPEGYRWNVALTSAPGRRESIGEAITGSVLHVPAHTIMALEGVSL